MASASRKGVLGLSTALISAVLTTTAALGADPVYLDQGWRWSERDRAAYYTQDQGSRVMPLAWIKALKQPDGSPFLADGLDRYGYLPNPAGALNPAGLPVGFTSAGPAGGEFFGMTCAACHTRQISVAGTDYRIDGGPAIVDFQTFLIDLGAAFGAVMVDDASFKPFAEAVLGSEASDPVAVAELRLQADIWYLRYDTLMKKALPTPAWGPGRLDAVGMIFNRLTGLDLGPPPTFLIADNIRPADAPVRYPFLWNAPRQDKTQWPGFADNGNDTLGLARNVGEVYGVFGQFEPKKDDWHLFGVNYLNNNSANFSGLKKLENLIEDLGPPDWPFPVDWRLANEGQAIYKRTVDGTSCEGCHGIQPGVTRPIFNRTWKTPVQDVGTDSRQYQVLAWTAQTGVLEGASIPFLTTSLKPVDSSFSILGAAVIGSIVQNFLSLVSDRVDLLDSIDLRQLKVPKPLQELRGAFPTIRNNGNLRSAGAPTFAYESRVMQGIWAAAPYLHNGSVPTLADLLKPVDQRPKSFKIGPNYDPDTVGLAVEQTKFDAVLETTGCDQRDSGNSNCGHEFGTTLSGADKRALLEYLKVL